MRGSPPAWGSLLGARALRSPWAGATNTLSVLPCAMRCGRAESSRFLSLQLPLRSRSIFTLHTQPLPQCWQGQELPRCSLRDGVWGWVSPGASRSCREKGSLPVLQGAAGWGVHGSPAPGPGTGGLRCCPPSKSFARGSSNARPHQCSLEQLLKDPGRKIIPLRTPMAATPTARGKESQGQSWCPAWQDPRPGAGTSAAGQG